MIKAPFNFVPLPKKAYCPKWAQDIYHDIPFEDGVSGTISVKFTAETPVFIRNGHRKDEAPTNQNRRGSGDYTHFSNFNGKHFLPGTSVKGMIRNVMEIMTYGRLHVDKNAMFAQREWGNYPLFPFVAPKGASKDVLRETLQIRTNICCGWLKEEIGDDGNARYFVSKCAEYFRINHKRLDEFFEKDLFETAFGKHKVNGKLADEHKTASYKYSLLKAAGIPVNCLKHITFKEDEKYACKYQENRVMCCDADDESALGKGTIVFTGQPDSTSWKEPRGMGEGKFYEFVFSEDLDGDIEMNEEQYNNYVFIFSSLPDWDELREKMQNEGLPVFFRECTVNGKPAIKDLGLAFLYKLPYEQTPYEIEENYRTFVSEEEFKVDSNSPDMADCIFGYVNQKNKNSLKGRVQVSSFFCTNEVECQEYRLILNSPKASYYPIYIQQNNVDSTGHVKGSYTTYNNGVLSGWKRYNLRDKVWENCSLDETNNIDSYIQPLGVGSTFEGEIHFHNLKMVELGALLSSITFFGSKDCQHQIGQAKPYGFGRISWSDIKLNIAYDDNNKPMEEYYMAMFEQHMNTVLGRSWISSEPIENMFSMAHTVIEDDTDSHYMTLRMKDKNTGQEACNDFQDAKDNKEYLRGFNALYHASFIPESKVSLIKQYELDSLIYDLNRRMNDCDYENAKNLIKKMRNEFDLDSSTLTKIKSYEELIINTEKEAEIKATVGDASLESYISDAKYIGPLTNKVLDWCNASSISLLQQEQIDIVKAKIKNILEATPEKKRKNVIKDISKALDKLSKVISTDNISQIAEIVAIKG